MRVSTKVVLFPKEDPLSRDARKSNVILPSRNFDAMKFVEAEEFQEGEHGCVRLTIRYAPGFNAWFEDEDED